MPPSHRSTVVTVGTEDNYFGVGTVTHVSVTPHSSAGVWRVVVAEEAALARAQPVALMRTDRDFQTMQRALEDCAFFSQPLHTSR